MLRRLLNIRIGEPVKPAHKLPIDGANLLLAQGPCGLQRLFDMHVLGHALSAAAWSRCHGFCVKMIALDELNEGEQTMNMRLELVPVPVADVDRARRFYVDHVGFNLDHDVQPSETMRVVQLTPPGSACSIVIGTGMGELSAMQPGSVKGLHLVVAEIYATREALVGRGVAVSEIEEYPGGIKYAYFSDPDGNSWALQEIPPDAKAGAA